MAEGTLICAHCNDEIEECAFCDSGDCAKPVCLECVQAALGQAKPHPHTHGG
jgi:hypothetical protein